MDEDVIACIDTAILSAQIVVPPLELREVEAALVPSTQQDNRCQASALGFRVATQHSHGNSLARLRRLIVNLYSDRPESLKWALRKVEGGSSGDKIETLMRDKEPVEILQQFVLASPENLESCLKQLRCEHLKQLLTEQDEEKLLQILMWKLGFNEGGSISSSWRVLDRFEKLRETALLDIPKDKWRDQVRSIGVNAFVSTEEWLNEILSFSTWVLLGEHVQDKYKFDIVRGRNLASRELSGLISVENNPVILREDGKNTLFPLVCGLRALAIRTEQILSESDEGFLKPMKFIPEYAVYGTLQMYPFRHQRFCVDADRSLVDKVISELRNSADRLEKSGIYKVRNGIDHQSDAFPSKEEIVQACDGISEVARNLEELGLAPVIYTFKQQTRDSRGRISLTAVANDGKQLRWFPSPSLHCCNHHRPSYTDPQIFVRALDTPGTGEVFRCGIVPAQSTYQSRWLNFPDRQFERSEELDASEEPSNEEAN